MLERLKLLPTAFLTADKNSLSLAAYAFLVFIALAFFLPGFTTLPPTDRDESLFSQATKQMLETGNYTDIRFQNEPRYKKPIGIYWLQAASTSLFGQPPYNDIWTYRIPSLIAATIAVLATAAIGATLFSPLVGFLAALMMASSVLLNVEARLAKTDAALLASILLMQWALARAFMQKSRSTFRFFIFWGALAAGILIKGPIILIVLLGTLIWLSTTEKNLGWFACLYPRYGIPLLLLLVAPWFTAIILQSQGSFVSQSAGQDLLAKIWQGHELRGALPPATYALVLPIVFFPCAIIALLAIPDVWASRKEKCIRFCLGWIIPTWIVFELSLTKLPHYVLPAYPAIAILAAKMFCDGYPTLLNSGRKFFPALSVTVWSIVGFAFATAGVALPYIMNDNAIGAAPILAGLTLITTQGLALVFLLRRRAETIPFLITGMLIFNGCTFGITLPNLHHLWLAKEITQEIAKSVTCTKPHIISASYNEPSLILLAGTETQQINDGAAVAAALPTMPCGVALLDSEHKEAFDTAAAHMQSPITAFAQINGYNLGRGKNVRLTLYALTPNTRQ